MINRLCLKKYYAVLVKSIDVCSITPTIDSIYRKDQTTTTRAVGEHCDHVVCNSLTSLNVRVCM